MERRAAVGELLLRRYGRSPKFHRVVWGRDPGTLKSDIVSQKKRTSTIKLLGFETLKLKVRRLKLRKPTVPSLLCAERTEGDWGQGGANAKDMSQSVCLGTVGYLPAERTWHKALAFVRSPQLPEVQGCARLRRAT